MKHLHKSIALALLTCSASLTFAGCGGGDDSPISTSGDGGNSQPPPATRLAAAGFWGGPVVFVGQAQSYSNQTSFWDTTTTDGDHIALVVLPSGETWTTYISGGVIINTGHGQTQVSESNVNIGPMTIFNPPWAFGKGGYNGYVIPKSQLVLTSGIVSSASATGAAPAPPKYPTTYDSHYDQPALLTQLAGTYAAETGGTYYSLPASAVTPGTDVPDGATPAALSALSSNYAISISSTGAVILPPDPLGCSGTGTATPRTDSNVFNLSLQFSGSKCVLGNGARVNGIAVVENGHLLMMAVPPGTPTAGEFVFVSK